MKYNDVKRSSVDGRVAKTEEKRKSFRVVPPLNVVSEIAVWFKGFDASTQINLFQLGMPDMVSVNKEKRIVLEDISGSGLRISVDKKVLALNEIKRISDRLTIFLKLDTPGRSKAGVSSMLIGIQLTAADSKDDRVVIRGRILVQARPDLAHNKMTFFNVERSGVKDIHVLREEISRLPKNNLDRLIKKVDMEKLLVELMADDDTQIKKISSI